MTAAFDVYVCPICLSRSYHPDDIRSGYCGRCHAFTRVCACAPVCAETPVQVAGGVAMCAEHADELPIQPQGGSTVSSGWCPCGRPLHYTNPETEAKVRRLVDELGEFIDVTVGDNTWTVSRHLIALHGIRAEDLPTSPYARRTR